MTSGDSSPAAEPEHCHQKVQNGACAEPAPAPPTFNKRALHALYAAAMINQTSMFIYQGIMPFLCKQYGMDPVTFGYFLSLFSLLTFLSSPIVGRLADVFGSRSVLVASTLSASAAHLTMGLARGVPMLFVSRTVSLLMAIQPAAMMTVTDLVPPSERSKYLGKIMIPISFGMIVGPTVGGTLSKYLGHQPALMLTWIPPLVATFIILSFIPKCTKKQTGGPAGKKGGINWSRLSEFVTKGDIPYLLVMRLLSTIPFMVFTMNFPLAGINFFHLSPQGNGFVMSALGVMNMINNWYVLGYLTKKFPGEHIMKWIPALSIPTYLFLSQTTSVWQLVLALYPVNLCFAVMENQVVTRLTRSVEAKDTSTMVGIGTALLHLARTISPSVGGILMQRMGWTALGQIGFVVSILMTTLSFMKYR